MLDNDHDDDDDNMSTPPPPATVYLMFATVGDTTWRLFIPTIGGTLLGLWADKSWHTTPWLTVVGIVLGSTIAIWLVYLQIKKIRE